MSADFSPNDEYWMRLAIAEAETATQHADVPVGCVVVNANGQLLAADHNRREQRRDPTAHAEVLALKAAAAVQRHWRLEGVTVYSTLEPCPMCAGALVNARIARLVYATPDLKAGAVSSLFTIGADLRLNHRFEIASGCLQVASVALLQRFFAELRAAKARAC